MQTITAQEKNVLPVGELIISNELTTPQTVVNKVSERFFSTTDLEAIAVVEDGEPVGLVTRTKLLFTLFRRFGFELYGKHPIIGHHAGSAHRAVARDPLLCGPHRSHKGPG